MQITDEGDYEKRALYYWAKIYTEQLKKSENYSKLEKAIGIHILNFTSLHESAKYHNVFHITEKESGLLYFRDLELHTIELSKFINNTDETLTEILGKVQNALDMWSAFLMRNDLFNEDNLPIELDKPDLKKAINVLEVMNFSEEERQAYEDRHKWLMIEENTIMNYERKGMEKGIEKGVEIGEARGVEKSAQATALNMLKEGLSAEIISKCTGLSQHEINLLKSKR